MTQYAHYDHTITPTSPVLGWYDTVAFTYPSLPPMIDMIEVTDTSVWANHTIGHWGVNSGQVIPITIAGPTTLQLQASAALLAGIIITSISSGTLNGTYDVSPQSTQSMAGVLAGIGAGIGLPGGGATFLWPDTSGTPHAFNATNFKNFASAASGYTYTLNQIIGGAILALPDFNITIA